MDAGRRAQKRADEAERTLRNFMKRKRIELRSITPAWPPFDVVGGSIGGSASEADGAALSSRSLVRSDERRGSRRPS